MQQQLQAVSRRQPRELTHGKVEIQEHPFLIGFQHTVDELADAEQLHLFSGPLAHGASFIQGAYTHTHHPCPAWAHPLPIVCSAACPMVTQEA